MMTINDDITEAAKVGAAIALAEGMVDILANVTRGVAEGLATLPAPAPEPVPVPGPVPTPEPVPVPVPAPAVMTVAEQTEFLKAIGLAKLPANRAWSIFQAAYNLGPALSPDGVFGALTDAAAKVSKANGYKISANFKGMEFLCYCKGAYSDCDVWRINRRVLVGLEIMRTKYYPAGMHINSGYRCRRGNIDAGSKMVNSRHRYGDAADIPRKIKPSQLPANVATTLNTVGYGSHGMIVHVDHTPGRGNRLFFKDGW